MKSLTTFICLLVCCIATAQTNGFTVTWHPPNDRLPLTYIIAHGMARNSFYECRTTDQTNMCYQTAWLQDGTNWFAVAALDAAAATDEFGRNDFRLSGWSNWVAVRRIPALTLSSETNSQIETSTDLQTWLPWTNSGPVLMTNDMRYFKGPNLLFTRTNLLELNNNP